MISKSYANQWISMNCDVETHSVDWTWYFLTRVLIFLDQKYLIRHFVRARMNSWYFIFGKGCFDTA